MKKTAHPALDPKWNRLLDALRKVHGLAADVETRIVIFGPTASDRDEIREIRRNNALAFCWYRGKKAGRARFDIMIRRNVEDEVEIAMLLGHELKHVAQMVAGVLALVEGGYIWNGVRALFSDVPHDSRPHEIEARRFEQPALQKAFNLGLVLD